MQQTLGNPKQVSRLKLAALLGSLAAFAPLSIDMYLPALPLIANEMNTTQSFVQLSLTFFLIGLALGQLVVGPLSDMRGRRIPLLIGLAVYSMTSVLCVFSPSIWAFILLRFVQGFSGAAGIVLSRAIVRDLYSGVEMTKFFSLLALVNGIAPVLAPVLGGIILLFAPWKGVFVILSVIGAIMFFLVLFSLRESLSIESRSTGGIKQAVKTFKQLLVDRSFIGYALSLASIYCLLFAYISGSSFVLQNMYGLSPQMYSIVFALNGVGIAIVAQITGRLVGRVTERKLLLIGIGMAFVGSCAILILLVIKAHLIFVLPALLLAVSSIGMVSTTGQSLSLQNQGKVAGSASAFIGVLQYVLAGTVAPLTGLGSNVAISMGIVMLLGSVGAILSYFFIASVKQVSISREQEV